MQNESDKVLIDRIQAGDAAAFEAMVIQYRPKLIASLVKYTKSVELSEDIAQQTFIKVWQKIDTFRGDSALFTWIYRIGINLAKNTFNSKSVRNDGITDNLENIESLIAFNESPEAFTISMSLKAELDNFLRELPIDFNSIGCPVFCTLSIYFFVSLLACDLLTKTFNDLWSLFGDNTFTHFNNLLDN